MEAVEVILLAAKMMSQSQTGDAAVLIEKEYRHNYVKAGKRDLSNYEKLKIYRRDGFIDRYSGRRLLFPPVLRIFSIELGDVFPFQQNWKLSECHITYWALMRTHDHKEPIARGGKDQPENIYTTSQMMNSMKSNFTIEELGLHEFPPGDLGEWDGMIEWQKEYIKTNKKFLEDRYISEWNRLLGKIEEDERRTSSST